MTNSQAKPTSYRIVVVLQMKTYVYNLGDMQLIDCLDTCSNPKGLVALNTSDNNAVLATLFIEKDTFESETLARIHKVK